MTIQWILIMVTPQFSFICSMNVSDTEDLDKNQNVQVLRTLTAQQNTQALIDSALFVEIVLCSWYDSVSYVQKSLKINIFKQF